MSASSDRDLLRRLIQFELRLERESSEIVERFDWGSLIANPETSALWSGNFLEVQDTEATADQLASIADELQGRLGLEHRDVVPADPEHAEGLTPRFAELGWEPQRSLYMVLRREADRGAAPAAEVKREQTEKVRRAVSEAEADISAEAVEQRPVRDARLSRAGNGRWFAAPASDPGAACVLYEQDGVGQVETVVTRPEHRGRGLASAVVLAAVEASRNAGHELTFIVADSDDWPWKLYERLGFDRVGEASSFVLKGP